jgi:membrane protein DedA with SNARE-associated domain
MDKFLAHPYGKFLLGLWIGTILTFAATATLLVRCEEAINVPGEMWEVLSGILVFGSILLLCVTVILYGYGKSDASHS